MKAPAPNPTDERLAQLVRNGDMDALDTLVRRYQSFVYNVALRYVLNPQDAEDLSQEVLVKIVTRIGQFEGRSSFKTWVYRIVVNTFLDTKRNRMEEQITTFTEYGAALDSLPLTELTAGEVSTPDLGLFVQEAKLSCMLGMLLCLDRRQRLTFILGDLFGVPSDLGGQLFDVSPATFRKRLERARADLTSFMDRKCGLVNTANPCRCRGKTKSFVAAGWVDPKNLKFTRPTLRRVEAQAQNAVAEVDILLEREYVDLYRQHPYYDGPDQAGLFRNLLADRRVRQVFDLGEPPL